MNKGHATHFDDCGCLTARYEAHIATLEAELAASRTDALLAWAEAKLIGEDEDAANLSAANWQAHANALRDALEKALAWGLELGTADPEWVAVAQNALLETPAASLAAEQATRRALMLQLVGGLYAIIAPEKEMDSAACIALVERVMANEPRFNDAAASLAAHDAEVWEKAWKCGHEAAFTKHDAEVLERAAKLMDDHYPDSRFDGHYRQAADLPPLTFGDAIRALAAQAATHSELEVKP